MKASIAVTSDDSALPFRTRASCLSRTTQPAIAASSALRMGSRTLDLLDLRIPQARLWFEEPLGIERAEADRIVTGAAG